MTFQALESKRNYFLDLLDVNFNVIEPSYAKGGLWLQWFRYSNLLCTQVTRAITNYTPIGEYILHDCRRFNGYWNPRRDSLSHFVGFLEANPNAFTFIDDVVATTHWNNTCSMLTSAKLSTDYLVVGITRELDKEPSLHCYPIYISYKWSMLQQCVYLVVMIQSSKC